LLVLSAGREAAAAKDDEFRDLRAQADGK
jgi:hypothetical protein